MNVKKVAVVGLGYVGLPLAIALAKHYSLLGFDVNTSRIAELQQGQDPSQEVSREELIQARINFTANPASLKEANFIIVCVPTPIDENKKPDLNYLKSASKLIGENLSLQTIVVYESTVYPGVTEEVCAPILSEYSGLQLGIEFKVGYSPERTNPGDKERTVDKIVKIVAGMDGQSLDIIDEVYRKITRTHRASSIKVAEGAKVIENIQRDLNIALMNELAILFDKMGVNIHDVLAAAGTKWNFHQYHPGLVGGHCIGVDPYYLTYKAEEMGHAPEVILAGRKINDAMHKYYADKVLEKIYKMPPAKMARSRNVLVLGLTFKPNVTDFRNSRVKHFIKELKNAGINVSAYDPLLDQSVVEEVFNTRWLNPSVDLTPIDLVVLAVEHEELLKLIKQDVFLGKDVVRLKHL